MNNLIKSKIEKSYSMDDLKISMNHFYINDANYIKAKKIKDKNFKKDIFYTLNNFKKESKKYRLTKNGTYCFLYKYFYSINVMLHCLNAYLINVYLEENKINPQEDFEKIYRSGKSAGTNQNTLVKLFGNYLKIKNLKNEKNSILLAKLNIYENLFRNQISHGWIDVFFNINGEKSRLLVNEAFNKEFEKDNKISFVSIDNSKLDEFRNDLKKFKNYRNIKSLFKDQDFNFNIDYQIQGFNKKSFMLVEPAVKMKIDLSQINNSKEPVEFYFSLNNLILDILKIEELVRENKIK